MTRLTKLPFFAIATIALGSSAVLAGPELTKAYILSIVKDAKPEIDECGRSLHGDVVKARFTIEASGEVKDVQLEGKHQRDTVGVCIKQKLTALRFGPSLKAIPVTLPFHLGDEGPTPPPVEDKVADKSADKAADKAAVSGGKKLEKKEVADLLKVLQSNMSNCGTGVVPTHFTIEKTGAVRQIKIDGDHADDQVGKCVQTKLSRARFPSAQAPTPVSYPFRLE